MPKMILPLILLCCTSVLALTLPTNQKGVSEENGNVIIDFRISSTHRAFDESYADKSFVFRWDNAWNFGGYYQIKDTNGVHIAIGCKEEDCNNYSYDGNHYHNNSSGSWCQTRPIKLPKIKDYINTSYNITIDVFPDINYEGGPDTLNVKINSKFHQDRYNVSNSGLFISGDISKISLGNIILGLGNTPATVTEPRYSGLLNMKRYDGYGNIDWDSYKNGTCLNYYQFGDTNNFYAMWGLWIKNGTAPLLNSTYETPWVAYIGFPPRRANCDDMGKCKNLIPKHTHYMTTTVHDPKHSITKNPTIPSVTPH